MGSLRPGLQPSFAVVLSACLLAMFGGPSATAIAQTSTTRAAPAPAAAPPVHVAATEEQLWMAYVRDGRYELSHRGPTSPPQRGRPFNAGIVSLAAAGSNAYCFSDDGAFYRYADGWGPAVDLPQRQHVVDMIGVGRKPHALVPSHVAAQLQLIDPASATPTSHPFEPGDAPLSIVRYDSRGWYAVAACPSFVTADQRPGLTPRLCHARGDLILFWLSQPAGPPQVSYTRLDLSSGRWLSGGTVGVPRLTAFWVPVVNRVPTLVAAAAGSDGSEKLVVYRLLGDPTDAAPDTWRPADLQLSPLPESTGPLRLTDAFGYNQHLGVLLLGADGSAYLRFGRFGGLSAMPTLDVFAAEQPELLPAPAFQTLRLVILLTILALLLAVRRKSIVTPIDLPPGRAIALTLQRLAGCAVDLVPLAVLAALILRIDPADAVRQLARWAFNPPMEGSGLPEARVLFWWCLSAGCYTAYSLAMELAARRTVGKVLTRVELLAESGRPPVAWQLVTRNLLRFVEVMPPFWILGFFVVLSRNRQRVGDLFARTLAVRRVTAPTEGDDSADT